MDKKYTPEMSIINPQNLVQQDGDFVGAIADIKLAEIGAYAENDAIDANLSAERVTIAGNRAMLQEIQKRARKLVAMQVCIESQVNSVLGDFGDEQELKLSQRG